MNVTTQLDNYVKALIPEPFTILGVELKPFCLGHIFLMRRFDCKFSSDDPTALGGIDDLILGIAICSRTYEEFLEFINTPDEFLYWCREWGKAIRKHIKKNKSFSIIQQFTLFKEYMKSGVVTPKYWETQSTDDAMQSGAHWTHSVLTTLTSDLGYTQTEALNVSVAKALSDYYKHLERNGVVNLMSDEELEIIAKAEQK
jgi:hypothetical protein